MPADLARSAADRWRRILGNVVRDTGVLGENVVDRRRLGGLIGLVEDGDRKFPLQRRAFLGSGANDQVIDAIIGFKIQQCSVYDGDFTSRGIDGEDAAGIHQGVEDWEIAWELRLRQNAGGKTVLAR